MADTPVGALDSVDTTGATVAVKPAAAKGKFLSPTLAGTQHLDTEAGKSILENMQRLIDEKEAQKSSFLERLKDAAAWTTGGVQGPTEGLALRGKAREEQTTDIYNMRMQLAQQRAAAEVAKQQNQYFNAVPGAEPGAPGAPGAPAAGRVSPAQALINRLPEHLQGYARNLAARNMFDELTKLVQTADKDKGAIAKELDAAAEMERRGDTAGANALRRQVMEKGYGPQTVITATGGTMQFSAVPPGAPPDIRQAITGAPVAAPAPVPAPVVAPAPVAAPVAALREPDVNRATLTLAGPSDNWTPAPPPAPGDKTTPYKSLSKADRMVVDYLENQNKEGMLGKVKMPYVPSAAATPVAAPAVPVAPAAPVAPVAAAPIAPRRLTMEEIKEREAMQKLEAEKIIVPAYEQWNTSVDPENTRKSMALSSRIISLSKETPEALGQFARSGFFAAIGGLLESGVSATIAGQGNNISIPGVAEFSLKIPTLGANGQLLTEDQQNKIITNYRELANLYAQRALEYQKNAFKGQGAVSNLERSLGELATGSIKDPAELVIKREMALAELNKAKEQERVLFNRLYPRGGLGNFKEFVQNPERIALLDAYHKRVVGIKESKIDLPSYASRAPAAPAAPPAKYEDPAREKRYEEKRDILIEEQRRGAKK